MFRCKSDNIYNCYVGHTSNFVKRKYEHKCACYNVNSKSYNFKVYNIIRENGGWENWSMIEIHKQLCKNLRECERIEQELIENNNADMNMIKSFLSIQDKKEYKKEYDNENKEQIKQYQKEYRKTHKEHQKQYQLEYRNRKNEVELMMREDKTT